MDVDQGFFYFTLLQYFYNRFQWTPCRGPLEQNCLSAGKSDFTRGPFSKVGFYGKFGFKTYIFQEFVALLAMLSLGLHQLPE